MTGLSNRQVVFVGSLPRTGGTLLPYLLDGLPGVYTVPWEVPLATASGRVASPADVQPADPTGTVERLCPFKKGEEGEAKPLGRNIVTEFLFDEAAYWERLKALAARGELDERNHIAAQVWTLHEVLGQPVRADGATRLVAHSGRAMIFPTLEVLRRNEIGWYVYLRREPVAWWRSYVARMLHHPRSCEPEAVERILFVKAQCDQLAGHYQRLYPERYLVVDYEALVDRPRETLAVLCGRLGIDLPADYEPEPRFLGLPVGAESSFPSLYGQTRILPSTTPRSENVSGGTLAAVHRAIATALPLRLAPDTGPEELERVAEEVHRHCWLIDFVRKTVLERRPKRPAAAEAAAAPLAEQAGAPSAATLPGRGRRRRSKAERQARRRSAANAPTEPAPAAPIIAFVHIPKTAGGTVGSMLANAYSRDALHDAGNVLRNPDQAAYKMARTERDWEAWRKRGGRVTVGHISYGLFRQNLPSDTRYITFLREPVDRVLSQYHRHRSHFQRNLPEDTEVSLEAALAAGLPAANNLQTRMLCGQEFPQHLLPASALEDAKANLRSFAFVGIQERFEESIVLLQRLLGLAAVPYFDRHVNPGRPRVEEVPDPLLAAIAEHNRLDADLYAFALELFEQRVAPAGPELAAAAASLRATTTGLMEEELAKARAWIEQHDPTGTHRRVRTVRAAARDAGISPLAVQQVLGARRKDKKRREGRAQPSR